MNSCSKNAKHQSAVSTGSPWWVVRPGLTQNQHVPRPPPPPLPPPSQMPAQKTEVFSDSDSEGSKPGPSAKQKAQSPAKPSTPRRKQRAQSLGSDLLSTSRRWTPQPEGSDDLTAGITKKPRFGDTEQTAELLENEYHDAAHEAAKEKVSTVCKAISLLCEHMESHELLDFLPRARQTIHVFVNHLHLDDQLQMAMLEHAACWLAPWERGVQCWREFFRHIREFSSGEAPVGSGNGVLQAFRETSTGDRFTKGMVYTSGTNTKRYVVRTGKFKILGDAQQHGLDHIRPISEDHCTLRVMVQLWKNRRNPT